MNRAYKKMIKKQKQDELLTTLLCTVFLAVVVAAIYVVAHEFLYYRYYQSLYSVHWRTVGIIKPTKPNQEAVQMKLKQIGSNMAELDLGLVQVFFSYETPVAARLTDGTLIRTDERYSVTTTKHINKWLQGCEALTVPQDRISFLLTSPKLARDSDYDEVAS